MDKTTSSVEDFARQNCAAILHCQATQPTTASSRPYKCKTCGRTFTSTRALGWHRRSSHREVTQTENSGGGSPGKGPTVHECRVCGDRFSTGNSLDGHMKTHRKKSNVKRKGREEGGGEEAKKRRVDTPDESSETAVFPLRLESTAGGSRNEVVAGLERLA